MSLPGCCVRMYESVPSLYSAVSDPYKLAKGTSVCKHAYRTKIRKEEKLLSKYIGLAACPKEEKEKKEKTVYCLPTRQHSYVHRFRTKGGPKSWIEDTDAASALTKRYVSDKEYRRSKYGGRGIEHLISLDAAT